MGVIGAFGGCVRPIPGMAAAQGCLFKLGSRGLRGVRSLSSFRAPNPSSCVHATRRQRRQPCTRAQAPPAAGAGAAAPFPEEDGFFAQPPAEQPSSSAEWAGQDGTTAAGTSSSSGANASSSGGGKDGGLLGAVKSACLAYDRAVKANPVLTKALTSFVGFAVSSHGWAGWQAGRQAAAACCPLAMRPALAGCSGAPKHHDLLVPTEAVAHCELVCAVRGPHRAGRGRGGL